CNPNIGGTAKGHLVREIDALGGEMAINADKSLLQIKMLNSAKGAAVQSLRGQTDKAVYHEEMLKTLRKQQELTLIEGEAEALIVEDGVIKGVVIDGKRYYSKTVILASGVYLKAKIITGEECIESGPSGFKRAAKLSASLIDNSIALRRFKTGTPARIKADSIDYSVMEREDGDSDIYCFSFLTDTKLTEQVPCYLTYTNERTHKIIRDNIHRAPLFNGSIEGTGPRYCPSIEDKIMRFSNKERHQIFVEPESAASDLMYIQGMSSSLPKDVQLIMYRSIKGLERAEIVKWAYAIEYDAIDPTLLKPSLELKNISGLFAAGQLNGSSGYEEAAAQGLIAGINASRYIDGLEPIVLKRHEAYIGVLIDDLVTKGTNEPYRMMTARAEYRLMLRQDNADIRLTPLGREIGLVDDYRYTRFKKRMEERTQVLKAFGKVLPPRIASPIVESMGEPPLKTGIKISELLKRAKVSHKDIENLPELDGFDKGAIRDAAVEVKYEGYLAKEQSSLREAEQLENRELPQDFDYMALDNLRIEARQKLMRIKPRTLGQASRISGVSPADINVLIIYLIRNRGADSAK
ncbi:MAG: tRNA uridine-5-carboxymethylaminomethyl(34) synthesis enzyme MnmG, partial [Clostridia bacterium]|nr:tRNA uridine-5-carboxymethylaminomethyl(34) synthesis enzyme MnmG [Clostridia bacterium]